MFISILCSDLTLHREKSFTLTPLSTWAVAAVVSGHCISCCSSHTVALALLSSPQPVDFTVGGDVCLVFWSVCQVALKSQRAKRNNGGRCFYCFNHGVFSRYGSEHPQPTKRVAGYLPQHHPLRAASGWLSIPEDSVKANSQ